METQHVIDGYACGGQITGGPKRQAAGSVESPCIVWRRSCSAQATVVRFDVFVSLIQ
jgi:hypothetical protein